MQEETEHVEAEDRKTPGANKFSDSHSVQLAGVRDHLVTSHDAITSVLNDVGFQGANDGLGVGTGLGMPADGGMRDKPRWTAEQRNEQRAQRNLEIYQPQLEVRSVGEGFSEVDGLLVPFSSRSVIHDEFGSFGEVHQPSVVDDAFLQRVDCRLLINHSASGPALPLARTKSGTLKLSKAPEGIRIAAQLDTANSQLARDTVSSIKRGDTTGLSIGFIVAEDEWNTDFSERSITRYRDIVDASIVAYPAFKDTHVSARAKLNRDQRRRSLLGELDLLKLKTRKGAAL